MSRKTQSVRDWVCPACGRGPYVRGARHRCGPPEGSTIEESLAHQERQRLALVDELPEESRKLLGDRLAELFAAVGIPECPTCAKRKEWINAAHRWVMARWS